MSALHINWDGIQSVLLARHSLPKSDLRTFNFAIKYLHWIYGSRKRRLGSLAVLHPLRVTTFLSNASQEPQLAELLTTLLHDVYEDINPHQVDEINWIHPDDSFKKVLTKLSFEDRWYLMERLGWLTKRANESYYQYIGRFLKQAKSTQQLVEAKLADRLDNTLDLRIALHSFSYHEKNLSKCRELLIDTMKYVSSGGIESVTAPKKGYRLDGLMISRFDDPNKETLKKKLDALYQDKPLMIEASIAFIVIFSVF